MPGCKDTLDDVQVAAVLSYIRQAWGNSAPPVEPALVASLRSEANQRSTPWTAQDFGLKAESKLGSVGEALEPPGKFAAAGFKSYLMICVGCHQIHGKGLDTGAGQGFPPLVGSDVVNGPQNTLIRVVLGGLEGKNNLLGGPPNETMPPWALAMSDEQIAQLLTFIRQAWGHAQGAVSVDAVRRLRAESKGRNGKLWNPTDLATAAALDAVEP